MNVNVELLIEICFNAERLSMRPRIANGRLGRLLHDIAELSGKC